MAEVLLEDNVVEVDVDVEVLEDLVVELAVVDDLEMEFVEEEVVDTHR